MTTEAITEPMPGGEPPATVTVRRSWAIGGAVAVVAVIVAMAITLAAVAGDDHDGFDGHGFPAATGSAPPGAEGMTPPSGMPYGGGPEGAMPGPGAMPGQGEVPDLPQPPDGGSVPGGSGSSGSGSSGGSSSSSN